VALAVHFIVKPLALVLFLVTPDIDSVALDLVHLEFSFVDGAICESQSSSSIFLTFEVLAFINRTIWPGLVTVAMLLIVLPLTHIFCTICMGVGSHTVGFVVLPLTLVDITISVIQFALSIRFSLLPLAVVAGPVEPSLDSVAVPLAVEPLSFVDGSVVKGNLASCLSHSLFKLIFLIAAICVTELVHTANLLVLWQGVRVHTMHHCVTSHGGFSVQFQSGLHVLLVDLTDGLITLSIRTVSK